MPIESYPVQHVLGDLLSALERHSNAVLIAPPGAGKTTLVAPALLPQTWCSGKILLLSPRRLAARMAAEYMSAQLGQPVGETVGYATRMDSKLSNASRIIVMTEGIFRNRIISDPELDGISAVLFDEVHERSLDSDFGLALALEAQSAFRPDLRLIAMSATLDGDRFSKLMDDAPVIESEGKNWPLQMHYAGRDATKTVEQEVARVIKLALLEAEGDILAFLPGVREIDRTIELLALPEDRFAVHALHGQIEKHAQQSAVKPDKEGRRKIILATNIAETSLTIDGVRIVVDSGLTRRSRFDAAVGVNRLVTEKASLSAVTQRSGRAARQAPGTCYRLWQDAGNGGLPAFDPPEILESDLMPLLLDCASWGEGDPSKLRWLDPPPLPGVETARRRLRECWAIAANGAITDYGKRLAKLPLPPELAHMVLQAAERGQAHQGALLAIMLQERGLGGGHEDLTLRFERLHSDNGKKASAAKSLAARISAIAGKGAQNDAPYTIAQLVAIAFPSRVARRRDNKGEDWISVMGRGLRLDPTSGFTKEKWLAVADMQGAASGAKIFSAAALEENDVLELFADRVTDETLLRYDRSEDRVLARNLRRLGGVALSDKPDTNAGDEAIAEKLCEAVTEHGLEILPWTRASLALLERARFAGVEALSEGKLASKIVDWLVPLCLGVTRIRQIDGDKLHEAIRQFAGWNAIRQIDEVAPESFHSADGGRYTIDYSASGGPTVELRVQAIFGLDQHPVVGANRTPLLLSLTSPAGRPIQTTRDLPAFWRGSWHDVAKEMRGRYPKHVWPDEPWAATASLKTKNALNRNA